MTVETLITFGLSDITNIRVVCSGCKGEVMSPLNARHSPPERCPYCDANWKAGSTDAYGRVTEFSFLSAMRHLLNQTDTPIELRFEIRDEAHDRG